MVFFLKNFFKKITEHYNAYTITEPEKLWNLIWYHPRARSHEQVVKFLVDHMPKFEHTRSLHLFLYPENGLNVKFSATGHSDDHRNK